MLKTKTISTAKATFLMVERPEEASDLTYPKIGIADLYFDRDGEHAPEESYISIAIPTGNWQLLGRIPDITEDQAKLVVPEYYLERLYATESIYDILQANEVYFENPLGDEPKQSHWKYWTIHNLCMTDKWKSDYDKWQEAQSKVWDKERCYLFIKAD